VRLRTQHSRRPSRTRPRSASKALQHRAIPRCRGPGDRGAPRLGGQAHPAAFGGEPRTLRTWALALGAARLPEAPFYDRQRRVVDDARVAIPRFDLRTDDPELSFARSSPWPSAPDEDPKTGLRSTKPSDREAQNFVIRDGLPPDLFHAFKVDRDTILGVAAGDGQITSAPGRMTSSGRPCLLRHPSRGSFYNLNKQKHTG